VILRSAQMLTSDFLKLPLAVQIQLTIVTPLLAGAVCGFLLGISEAAYWVGQVIATLGGVAGGSEHPSARHGAIRGALAGAMFGTGLVIAHEASEAPALATLPSPAVVMIAVTGAVGTAMGALGATLSKRLRDAAQPLG
jgi:hypothetical protein